MYKEPNWDAPIDWQQHYDAVPKEALIRGMFLQDMVNDLHASGKTPRVGESRYIGFKNYPTALYVDLLRDTCQQLYPHLPPRRALRLVGQKIYPRFANTMVGRSIFSIAGNSFERIIKLAVKAYDVSDSVAKLLISSIGPGYARVMLQNMWTFADSMQIGVWEGAMQVSKTQGAIKVRVENPSNVELDLTWQIPA